MRQLTGPQARFMLVARSPRKLTTVAQDLLTRGAAEVETWVLDLDDTANYFQAQRAGTLAVISSVAGDRGRKSNYVYGAAKGAVNIFLDGVRNRIDRDGVQVLTIKPGFVDTAMTANVPKTALFATPDQVAKGIVSAIEKRKDVAYVPWFWAGIMLIIRLVPGRVFKKLNL
jgi:decaprenylphospho-beta-D-erythro-pentofuranosid-2-ulose 2-reductase